MRSHFQNFVEKILKPAHKPYLGRFIFYYLFTTILLLLATNNNSIAAEPKIAEDYQIIKDLNDDWLVFDNQYKDYVPYLKTRHYNYQSLSQYFDIENYKGYKLLIYSGSDSYLFISGVFQKKLPINIWLSMDIDSLFTSQKSPHNLLLTIYKTVPDIENDKILVAYKPTKKGLDLLGNENNAALKARKFSNFKDFAILFSLFLLGSITFLYNFQNSILTKFINIKDLFTITKRTDSIIINRPFDVGNILYMVILSLSMSLILLIIEYNFIPILPKQLINDENPTFLNLSGQFFNLSFLILIAFITKYLFISIIGNLYRFDKITNIHFFKNLQSTGIFAFILLLILVLLLIYPLSFIQNFKATYLSMIASFYVLRLFLLFFNIIKVNPTKNLYLFSYLCIVELIPLFLGIRFAL